MRVRFEISGPRAAASSENRRRSKGMKETAGFCDGVGRRVGECWRKGELCQRR